MAWALQSFDRLYMQKSGETASQQLQVQLANAIPYDLDETELPHYKSLALQWHDWNHVKATCAHLSTVIFDRVCDFEDGAAGARCGE